MGTVWFYDLTICQIVFPHGRLANVTNVKPTYCHSSVNAFSHSLDTDPLAVGNCSPGRAIWGESSWVCLSEHSDEHKQEAAKTHKHSNIVLRETTASKKVVWNLVGMKILIGGIRAWCQERDGQWMFWESIHHAAQALFLSHTHSICILYDQNQLFLQEIQQLYYRDSSKYAYSLSCYELISWLIAQWQC